MAVRSGTVAPRPRLIVDVAAAGLDVMKLRNPLFRDEGVEFSGPEEALEALRLAAQQAIAEADRLGIDVRWRRVRVSDQAGFIVFDGTFWDAAVLDVDACSLPPAGE